MSHNIENQTLTDTRRDTEAEILEIQRQLDLGTEEATAEFVASNGDLRTVAANCLEAIECLSKEAQAELEVVQQRLGRLNFLLEVEEFDDVEMLDRHSEAILDEMRGAREGIAAVEGAARKGLLSNYGEVEAAWHRFLRCIELIRLHLREAEDRTDQRFAGEREILRKRLAEGRKPEHSLMSSLWEGLKEHERWIEAFFRTYLGASLAPPPPEYSSTEAASDESKGR